MHYLLNTLQDKKIIQIYFILQTKLVEMILHIGELLYFNLIFL